MNRIPFKTADFLLAARNITYAMRDHADELKVLRSDITNEYIDGLEEKINKVLAENLGVKSDNECAITLRAVNSIRIPALRDVSFLKTQVETDFKKDKEFKKILTKLGINDHFQNAINGDREAFIELLHNFNEASKKYTKRIVEKGTNPVLIERIVNYTKDIDLKPLRKKTKTKLKPGAAASKVNNDVEEIYNEINKISKIAINFYQYDPLIRERFTINSVVRNISVAKKVVLT